MDETTLQQRTKLYGNPNLLPDGTIQFKFSMVDTARNKESEANNMFGQDSLGFRPVVSTQQMYIADHDIMETISDGRVILIAAKGTPIQHVEAVRLGLVPNDLGPQFNAREHNPLSQNATPLGQADNNQSLGLGEPNLPANQPVGLVEPSLPVNQPVPPSEVVAMAESTIPESQRKKGKQQE